MKDKKNDPILDAMLPHGKKVLVKKGVQKKAAHYVGKCAVKTVVKRSPKLFFKNLANPWLLVSDVVDLSVQSVCKRAGVSKKRQKITGKASGLITSAGIGCGFGGPVGGAAGVVLWGVGEGVCVLFGSD